ncbi:hypothetical protein L202_05563 [Cryptococcus amylolentus CBS 6039]|uniref:RING-type E3 ubiquitin transferase n=1 Tax=Cryptococcus amylolentus CBS 6039 TaxID=1295533 RepID=A0A1E3HKX9_9TREE|nr:hypothetical protein L202_05563 [Cryptococcus amylolentus CBS 6039]ODN77017.1 hypothetical protein L202_05563 [Cryptococcus amylolentus CBS 6039]
MPPRLAIYGVLSTVLAASVLASALQSRANFYAAAVSVGKSSGSLMVIGNFLFFNALCLGIALKKLFFGQLRAIEYERLWERLWAFMTESLLALAIFREDFNIGFILMLSILIFLKCFHWITADRVDYMDQIPPPGPPKTFHARMVGIITILMVLDLFFVSYALNTILTEGVSSMIIFTTEFLILQTSIAGTAARYSIGMIDLRRARGREDAPPWEAKSMYLFYVDLAVDFVKLLTYLMFFTVIFLNYGLPIHILRDVYFTFTSFVGRCKDLVRYRQATRDMDSRYPDATEDELERNGDRTCIICREEMMTTSQREREGLQGDEGGPNETPKKLVCGHIFHFHCLRSWLERQQKCPTCRRDVLNQPDQTTVPVVPVPAAAAPAHDVPQPAAAPPAEGAADRARDILRDRLFPINDRQDPATPPRTRPPTAAPTNLSEPTRPVPGPTRTETVDHGIQRGIWGGPIIPGRFQPLPAPPLGAAPRFSSYTRSVATTPVAQYGGAQSPSYFHGAAPHYSPGPMYQHGYGSPYPYALHQPQPYPQYPPPHQYLHHPQPLSPSQAQSQPDRPRTRSPAIFPALLTPEQIQALERIAGPVAEGSQYPRAFEARGQEGHSQASPYGGVSGSVTPWHANPPFSFSSTGDYRAAGNGAGPAELQVPASSNSGGPEQAFGAGTEGQRAETEGTVGEEKTKQEEAETDGLPELVIETSDLKTQVAQAALRRFQNSPLQSTSRPSSEHSQAVAREDTENDQGAN